MDLKFQEIPKELVSHLEQRQANQLLLQKCCIQILNKDLILASSVIQNKLKNANESNQFKTMKIELSNHGYTDFKFLGAGEQGCVILAKKSSSNKRFAIKGIQVRDSEGNSFDTIQEECKNEINVLKKCGGSPYSLTLFEVIEEQQMTYLILNECKGTMSELLDQEGGKLNEYSAIKYSKDVAEGILHIHSQGFLVQDLKLDNIFIDYNNNAVVGDLGLGNKIKSNTSYGEGLYVGNLTYCAPEVLEFYNKEYASLNIQVSQKPTKSCDAFSLGYLLYSFIVGAKAIREMVTKKNQTLQFGQEFKKLKYFQYLQNIIVGLTKFNPKERMKVQETCFILKGMVSTIFNLEAKFNESMYGDTDILKSAFREEIEFIQISKNSYFPILKNETNFLSTFYLDKQQKEQSLLNKIQELETVVKDLQQELDLKSQKIKEQFVEILKNQTQRNLNQTKQILNSRNFGFEFRNEQDFNKRKFQSDQSLFSNNELQQLQNIDKNNTPIVQSQIQTIEQKYQFYQFQKQNQ